MKYNYILSLIIFRICFSYINVSAKEKRNFLSGDITAQELKSILIPRADWHPFPSIQEINEWNKFPEKTKNLYIKNG